MKKKTWMCMMGMTMLLDMTAMAEDESVWEFDEDRWEITDYLGEGGDVQIPGVLDGDGVIMIGSKVFYGMDSITSLSFDYETELIKDGVGSNCTSLQSIDLPDYLKSIGEGSFSENDALEEVIIPEMVTYIDKDAFSNCRNLRKVTFYGYCPIMCDGAFDHIAEDATVYVAEELVDDYKAAFASMHLTQIPDVQPDSMDPAEFTDEDFLDGGYLKMDADTETITAYYGWYDEVRLTIPESIDGVDVKAIGPDVFNSDPCLAYLALPEGMEAIGNGAFSNMETLQYVKFPSTLKEIGDQAFANSFQGRYLELPENIVNIGAEAFESAWIETLKIDNPDLSGISETAFANCRALQNVEINEACTQEQKQELQSQMEALGLTCKVRIAGEPDEAETEAPTETEMESSTELETFTEEAGSEGSKSEEPVDENTFREMPDQPSPEEDFGFDAATGTITDYTGSEEHVVIPRSIGGVPVTAIAYMTFNMVRNLDDNSDLPVLRSVVIPETVVTMEDSVFSDCMQLESVICYGPLESSGKSTFLNCKNLKQVIYVNGLRILDSHLFEMCENLETVWYKGQVDLIAEQCFAFSGLKTIVVNAKEVGEYAFSNCPNLETVHVRSGMEQLWANDFAEDPNLRKICLESDNPNIFGEYYFGELDSLIQKQACDMPDNPMPDIVTVS